MNRSILLSNEEKAFYKRNLKFLIIPWLGFKLYVKFKPNGIKKTVYSNDHCCTYDQCVAGHVKTIVLNRKQGYFGLIQLVEEGDFRDKYLNAKIYGRDPGGSFSILHRCYDYVSGRVVETVDKSTGEVKRLIEPEFTDHNGITQLFFNVAKDRLFVSDKDFKSLLSEQLNQQ